MRRGSFVFVVLGLLGACFSFFQLAGVSLPYQDATPEMLMLQAEQVQFWERSLFINVLVAILAGLGIWRFRRNRKSDD